MFTSSSFLLPYPRSPYFLSFSLFFSFSLLTPFLIWKAVNDFYVGEHHARAWCYAKQSPHTTAPACALQARCCKPSEAALKLHCVHGSRGHGAANEWGQWSVCPPFYTALSVMRIHTADGADRENKNIAKYECKSDAANDFEGCRAWGWRSEHNTWAKCCRVLPQSLP